jgi:DNA-directed RNA polymerase alpha subunit
MKSIIIINILEVSGHRINLIQHDTRFQETTKKTMKKLCETIEKYFNDHNIKVKAKFEIENGK